jgi:uncharacterized metal-binding protein YceD (DUF177 family)
MTTTDPLGFAHATADIPERGLSREQIASSEERLELARQLDIEECRRLAIRYTLRPASRGRYVLDGTLQAEVVQACVVSLEPVESTIEEAFRVEFWPADDVNQSVEGESEVLSGPDIEPIDNGVLRVGRVVFELLAAALDPYPRKPGAAFDEAAGVRGAKENGSPFAVLQRLKTGKDDPA